MASNHLTEKEKLIMNGAIGRVQEKEEDEEPEETSGPKPILPYTSMFVFKSEDQIRVACHYIGNVAIRCPGFPGKVSPNALHHGNQSALSNTVYAR